MKYTPMTPAMEKTAREWASSPVSKHDFLFSESEYERILEHDTELQGMGLIAPDRIPLRQFVRAIELEEETLP